MSRAKFQILHVTARSRSTFKVVHFTDQLSGAFVDISCLINIIQLLTFDEVDVVIYHPEEGDKSLHPPKSKVNNCFII